MFCFIAGQNTENQRFIMTYEDKQLYFTLYKETEFGKQFYEKIKAAGPLKLPMYKEILDDYKDLYIHLNDFDESVIGDPSVDLFHAGDIIINSGGSYYPLTFVLNDAYYYAQKIGEIEESSIDGFISLLDILTYYEDNSPTIVTFTVEEPEQSGYSLIIIYVCVMVALLFIVFIIIIYKFLF